MGEGGGMLPQARPGSVSTLLEYVPDPHLPAGHDFFDGQHVSFRQYDGFGGRAMHLHGSSARVHDDHCESSSVEPIRDLLLHLSVAVTGRNHLYCEVGRAREVAVAVYNRFRALTSNESRAGCADVVGVRLQQEPVPPT